MSRGLLLYECKVSNYEEKINIQAHAISFFVYTDNTFIHNYCQLLQFLTDKSLLFHNSVKRY